MAGSRRRGRIVALQTLYEADCVGHDPQSIIQQRLEEQSLPPAAETFARELVQGVLAHRSSIDAVLRQAAPLWPLEQIPAVDRNILRVAIFEILVNNEVPLKAAINEAIELAKAFGSENSAKFVNGVLGTVSSLPKLSPLATVNSVREERS